MTMTTPCPSCAESLAVSVGFDLLGERLGGDVEGAFRAALKVGAVFPGGGDALAIFRHTLAASIRDIECDERGRLFQRFLRDGPYEHEGPIPPEFQGKRLTPEERAGGTGPRVLCWPILCKKRSSTGCPFPADVKQSFRPCQHHE